MTTLATGSKPGRKTTRRPKGASIREVCLIGGPIQGRPPDSGERIDRDGRRYRVEAVEEGGSGLYLHLKAEGGRRSDD